MTVGTWQPSSNWSGWDQLNIVPSELEDLVAGTGWTLQERLDDPEGYAVVLRRG